MLSPPATALPIGCSSPQLSGSAAEHLQRRAQPPGLRGGTGCLWRPGPILWLPTLVLLPTKGPSLPCLPGTTGTAAAWETHVRTAQGPGKSLLINLVSNPLIQLLLDLISEKSALATWSLFHPISPLGGTGKDGCHPVLFSLHAQARGPAQHSALPQGRGLRGPAQPRCDVLCCATLCRDTVP